jgi:hypothetical protein
MKMHSERITIINFLTFGRFPAACCRVLQFQGVKNKKIAGYSGNVYQGNPYIRSKVED